MNSKLKLVVDAGDAPPELSPRHSDHCPSLFDAPGVVWELIAEEMKLLEQQGVVVRDAKHPSGYKPAALEAPIKQKFIAASARARKKKQ